MTMIRVLTYPDMPDSMIPHLPVLDALLDRASIPPRLLSEPGPGEAALELAVAAALRAPDHGGLRPWRFTIVAGAARHRLGAALADSLARRDPEGPPERLELERAKPLRAPIVIAAGASLRHGHKIPVWEQEATAAAGVMNLMNALDAQGFGAMWLSSLALGDPAVKQVLGFAAEDRLLGWVYVGTPSGERPRPSRPDPRDFYRRWE
jgi:nitroreductase